MALPAALIFLAALALVPALVNDAFAEEEETPEHAGNFVLTEVDEATMITSFIVSALIIIAVVVVFGKLGKKPLSGILLNDHGNPTLSKLQFLLWTLVIAFSFLTIQILKIIATGYSSEDFLINEVPENLLVLMGISVAVPISTSALTKKLKTFHEGESAKSFGSMFQNNQGNLDLSRLQMFMWTIIGVSVYIYILFDQVFTLSSVSDMFLPDVSPTLVILMGLSQGAYLGSKMTHKETQA